MTDLTMLEKASAAWGGVAPDWIEELADMAERRGLNACATQLGYSSATISQTISNKYRGDLSKIEDKVRGALMGKTVMCPILGELGRHKCLNWQTKPRAITNATRTKMYHACRNGCPHSRLKGGGNVS
ncbi:transcriptional regulator [Roseibium porphyridii]|uniref:Transcriptional regulator n=1 Tax=Roseibium porphyridii TaxID=2866279 RepID=A0ABY8FBZ2_9HYPH|nr:transcriptional regulator [Roseibium sp. KMA01]WFE92284.1 transcriptional regulator [Roseibium sp. KMA01]